MAKSSRLVTTCTWDIEEQYRRYVNLGHPQPQGVTELCILSHFLCYTISESLSYFLMQKKTFFKTKNFIWKENHTLSALLYLLFSYRKCIAQSEIEQHCTMFLWKIYYYLISTRVIQYYLQWDMDCNQQVCIFTGVNTRMTTYPNHLKSQPIYKRTKWEGCLSEEQ